MTLSTPSFQEGANSLPAQPGRALGGKLRQALKMAAVWLARIW